MAPTTMAKIQVPQQRRSVLKPLNLNNGTVKAGKSLIRPNLNKAAHRVTLIKSGEHDFEVDIENDIPGVACNRKSKPPKTHKPKRLKSSQEILAALEDGNKEGESVAVYQDLDINLDSVMKDYLDQCEPLLEEVESLQEDTQKEKVEMEEWLNSSEAKLVNGSCSRLLPLEKLYRIRPFRVSHTGWKDGSKALIKKDKLSGIIAPIHKYCRYSDPKKRRAALVRKGVEEFDAYLRKWSATPGSGTSELDEADMDIIETVLSPPEAETGQQLASPPISPSSIQFGGNVVSGTNQVVPNLPCENDDFVRSIMNEIMDDSKDGLLGASEESVAKFASPIEDVNTDLTELLDSVAPTIIKSEEAPPMIVTSDIAADDSKEGSKTTPTASSPNDTLSAQSVESNQNSLVVTSYASAPVPKQIFIQASSKNGFTGPRIQVVPFGKPDQVNVKSTQYKLVQAVPSQQSQSQTSQLAVASSYSQTQSYPTHQSTTNPSHSNHYQTNYYPVQPTGSPPQQPYCAPEIQSSLDRERMYAPRAMTGLPAASNPWMGPQSNYTKQSFQRMAVNPIACAQAGGMTWTSQDFSLIRNMPQQFPYSQGQGSYYFGQSMPHYPQYYSMHPGNIQFTPDQFNLYMKHY